MELNVLMDIVHRLEGLQLELRHRHQWAAARSMEGTLDLLRKELELKTTAYENTYERDG